MTLSGPLITQLCSSGVLTNLSSSIAAISIAIADGYVDARHLSKQRAALWVLEATSGLVLQMLKGGGSSLVAQCGAINHLISGLHLDMLPACLMTSPTRGGATTGKSELVALCYAARNSNITPTLMIVSLVS